MWRWVDMLLSSAAIEGLRMRRRCRPNKGEKDQKRDRFNTNEEATRGHQSSHCLFLSLTPWAASAHLCAYRKLTLNV